MIAIRMLIIAVRLAGRDLFTPWRSPLLRWRLATYGVCDPSGRLLHADELTLSTMLTFLVRHRGAWWRFLRWAAGLRRA